MSAMWFSILTSMWILFMSGFIVEDSVAAAQMCQYLAHEMGVQYRLESEMLIFTTCSLRIDDEWVNHREADKLNWENR